MPRKLLDEDIRAAYRWVLGREADEIGLSLYVNDIAAGRLDNPSLRNIMLHSPEFRRAYHPKQEVAFADFKLIVNPHDPEFGQHIAQHREWETHVASTIRSILKPGDTFVDIGANIGVMSFHARCAVGESGKVIAFEPNPENADNYRRGIMANRYDNIVLYQFALSDRVGIITMSPTSNSNVVEDDGPLTINETAQALIGDHILAQEDRINLIKMDIEGYEPFAIRGLSALIAEHRPMMLIEFNPRCLKDVAQVDPAYFAAEIYTLAKHVDVIEGDGSRREIGSAHDLMNAWVEKNRDCVNSGLLPEGMAHFDLLVTTGQ